MNIKELTLENEFETITLEGFPSVLYFNRKNSIARVTILDKVADDYQLKLKSDCKYKVIEDMGYNRGRFKISFRTDHFGRVIKASDTACH